MESTVPTSDIRNTQNQLFASRIDDIIGDINELQMAMDDDYEFLKDNDHWSEEMMQTKNQEEETARESRKSTASLLVHGYVRRLIKAFVSMER